ncbi:MAG: trehalose-phosphatase, partial [Planctomycetota bacterium]|nr:trehalose-phosphatase [Planctomycetota bacterium]
PDRAVHRNAEGDRDLEVWIEAPRGDWYELARERMEAVTRSVAGSFVEQKSTGICWHHRKAEPSVGLAAARSLHAELSNLLAGRGVRVELGRDVVEARPADVTKGEAVERLRGAGHLDVDALIVAGDDTTDESMFEAFGERAHTVLVGERVSVARWRVGGPSDLRRLLGALADLRASGDS